MRNYLAVIGDPDFIAVFKALGCDLCPIDESANIDEVFLQAMKSDYLCIFIVEGYARKLSSLIGQYKEQPYPMIIPLADFRKDESINETLLSNLTVRAVGQDIIS